MNRDELYAGIRSLVDSLTVVLPEPDRFDCIELLDHGEAQEAMDVLIASLVRRNLPVTHEQRERLRVLIDEFELSADARVTWSYLSDPRCSTASPSSTSRGEHSPGSAVRCLRAADAGVQQLYRVQTSWEDTSWTKPVSSATRPRSWHRPPDLGARVAAGVAAIVVSDRRRLVVLDPDTGEGLPGVT